MPKIKNKNYREFLDKGTIKLLHEPDIERALMNVTGRYSKEGRALLITLYYTGGRPVEVLSLKPADIEKKGGKVIINMPAAKNGLPRPVWLNYKFPLVKELYKYTRSMFPGMFLFHHFRGKYERIRKGKVYIEVADKLRYYLNKWFADIIEDSIPPYYLRHNRLSKLSAAGATMDELRMFKGAKDFNSIIPYIHLSADIAKKISKKID